MRGALGPIHPRKKKLRREAPQTHNPHGDQQGYLYLRYLQCDDLFVIPAQKSCSVALASTLAVEPLAPAIVCTPNLLSSAEGAFIKIVRNAVNQPHDPCWGKQRPPGSGRVRTRKSQACKSCFGETGHSPQKLMTSTCCADTIQYAKTLQLINRGRIKATYVSEEMVVSKQG